MSKPHDYRINPEFTNLEKFVWEGLNDIGKTIPQIEKQKGKTISGKSAHKKSMAKPIWHTKSDLDEYVTRGLGLRLEDYGSDLGKNPLYKAIANEVGKLRRAGILIDWRRDKTRNTGMGLWRLDKTKLDVFVYRRANQEIKNENFHSTGRISTVFARQKQNAFRDRLFVEYGQCAFCKFKLPDYMIGAHIVPYSVMSKEDAANAMNPANGLLLCRFCDVAFEKGSIRLESDLGIIISDYLTEKRNSIVKSWLESIPAQMLIKQDAKYPPDPKYLKWKKRLLDMKY